MKFVAVGDISIDHYINLNVKKPGGIAFNIAFNAFQVGANAALVSAIGSDERGKRLKHLLEKLSLDTTHIRYMHGKTAKQKIVLEDSGERNFVGYTPGVLSKWKLTPKDKDFIFGHNIIFVPLSDGLEHIFEDIAYTKANNLKAVDFSQDYILADFSKENNVIKKYCPYFDINFISGDNNLISLLEELTRQYPQKIFIVTMGKEGSVAFLNGEKYIQPSKKINKVIDSTGCGDAFQAAFLVTYEQTRSMSLSLKKATEQASKVLQHIGSTNVIYK